MRKTESNTSPGSRQAIEACEAEVARARECIQALADGTFDSGNNRIVDVDAVIKSERQRLAQLEKHLAALRLSKN